MITIETLAIGGVLLGPIIAVLVEVAKTAGMPTKYARWLNGALTLLALGVVVWLGRTPENEAFASLLLNGLVIFLAAAGFYDVAVQPAMQKYADSGEIDD